MNDTEPAQRGGGSFTEGRSRWELALNPQPLTLTQNIQSGRAEPCPIVPRARESTHRRTRLFHRQVPGLSTINDRPGAFYTMPDSIIGPFSDGNADGSGGSQQTSLGLNSTVHGDGAEEPTPPVTAGFEENVVTDGPQLGHAARENTRDRGFDGPRTQPFALDDDDPIGFQHEGPQRQRNAQKGGNVNDTEPTQRGARFIYRGEIAQREWRYFLQPLHTTKDTQSKGAELHEPRTTVP